MCSTGLISIVPMVAKADTPNVPYDLHLSLYVLQTYLSYEYNPLTELVMFLQHKSFNERFLCLFIG